MKRVLQADLGAGDVSLLFSLFVMNMSFIAPEGGRGRHEPETSRHIGGDRSLADGVIGGAARAA